jgi:hypothetical protein
MRMASATVLLRLYACYEDASATGLVHMYIHIIIRKIGRQPGLRVPRVVCVRIHINICIQKLRQATRTASATGWVRIHINKCNKDQQVTNVGECHGARCIYIYVYIYNEDRQAAKAESATCRVRICIYIYIYIYPFLYIIKIGSLRGL